MESETADILGQPTLPTMEHIPVPPTRFSAAQWFFVLFILFLAYAFVMRVRQEILIWREKSFKLATRRKHGIPDTDRRPFNVAYTAAILARDEREKNERNRTMRQLPVQDTNHAEQALRHRTDRFKSSASVALPGAYTLTPGPISSPTKHAARDSSPYSPSRPNFADPLRPRKSTAPLYSDYQYGSTRHAARKIVDLISSEGDVKKRGLDEQDFDDVETTKKTRVEGDELIDGDEEAQWDDYETALSHQRRGSKRGLGEGEHDSDNVRDKRARKVSLDKPGRHGYQDEEMEIDDELDDELPDLHSPVRGKKRDRAEAGSTFGGDDDDSSPEDEKLRRRRRKRRTVAKRKSEAAVLNGKKHDRDMDIDEDLHSSGTVSRHRIKGKRRSNVHHRDHNEKEVSDISIDESLTSSARGRNRKLGEEWESNGVRYKLALNGQRLRQALVKKARHKFVMPQDSVHPDRDENLEVYVETWLTEDEYQDAKERMMLAWQDSPKQSVEPENLSVKIPAPKQAPVGKNLLWQSTVSTPSSSPASISPLEGPGSMAMFRPKGLRNPGRYSLGTNVGLRTNPFEKQSSISTKRIVSASIANQSLGGSPGLSDSTNSTVRPRTLSKWERQEIEANAIYKLRAARQAEIDAKAKEERERAEKIEREKQERERQERERQEQARVEKERQEKEKKEKEAAAAALAAATVPPQIPTITVTQPSTDGKVPASSGFSFGPSTSTSAPAPATNASTAETIKPTFFAPPPLAQGAANTVSTAPSLFGPPKAESAPAPLFSFKSPGAPASASPLATQAASPFSFGGASKPAAVSAFGDGMTEDKKETKPSPVFSFPQTATAPAGQAATAGSTATSAPKFSFFANGKPSDAGTQQPVGGNKPAAGSSAFAFPKPAATAGGSDPMKAAPITFGATSGAGTLGSAFGSNGNANTSSSLSNAMGPGGIFGGGSTFGSTTAKPSTAASGSVFGSTGAAPNATGGSAPFFGQPAAPGGFGLGGQDKGKEAVNGAKSGGFGGFGSGVPAPSSAFGSAAKPGESSGASPKPVFSFNAPSSGAGTHAPLSVQTQTPKSTFPFPGTAAGTTTPVGTPTTGGAGFTFNFSKPAAAATANGQKNNFGGSSQTPSAFGFATPPATAAAGSTTPAGTPAFAFGPK